MHAAGIRGVRHNLVGRSIELLDRADFLRMAERIAPLGWHFLLHMNADDIFTLADLLRQSRTPIVFDHLMRIDPSRGQQQPALRSLLDFLSTGNAWVKITAVDKLSREPYPHRDIVAIGARLVAAAPDRVIWGTDWPHPDGRGLRGGLRPDDRKLLELAPLYAPNERAQRKLLVDNPAHLYGFDTV